MQPSLSDQERDWGYVTAAWKFAAGRDSHAISKSHWRKRSGRLLERRFRPTPEWPTLSRQTNSSRVLLTFVRLLRLEVICPLARAAAIRRRGSAGRRRGHYPFSARGSLAQRRHKWETLSSAPRLARQVDRAATRPDDRVVLEEGGGIPGTHLVKACLLECETNLVGGPTDFFQSFTIPSPKFSCRTNHSTSLHARSASRLWPLRITTATPGFSYQTAPVQYRSNPGELFTSNKKWPPARRARATALATFRTSALRGT
jgi:hypothetical protein